MGEVKARLILKGDADETNVFQVARSRRWSLYDIGNRNSDIYMNIWFSKDGEVEIRYVEDPLTGLNFVTLRGEGSERVEQDIRSSLPTWEYREAVEVLREAEEKDHLLRAAYSAALTAPLEEDERLVEEMKKMSRSADGGIRQAVVVATGYCPWRTLVEIVEELRESDPVAHVRENARLLLEGLGRNGA